MKKLFLIAAIIGILLSSCVKKHKVETKPIELNVERTITLDKEYTFLNFGKDYVWYESNITLKEYLDSENTSDSITNVLNIFQTIKDGQPSVILINHNNDSTDVDVRAGFWIEDHALDSIKLTFKDAYVKAMQANYKKPHSRICVLRNPIGPKGCNPQYIFGNIEEQIWVDAITGEVSNSNPAF